MTLTGVVDDHMLSQYRGAGPIGKMKRSTKLEHAYEDGDREPFRGRLQ